MNAIIDAAFHHTRMVLVTLAVLFMAGTVAYVGIPKEAEPEIKMPLIFVSMRLEGVSPEDSERLLIRPIEEEMQALQGIKEVRATGFQGGATVILEFVAETNMEVALGDVRDAMDRARPKMPADADEPIIREFNQGGFPILTVSIAGDVPERTLLHLAQELRDRVAQLPNVLEANVSGTREEQVEIVIDPLRLEHYGISNQELFQVISRSNRLVAAGNIDTGQGKFAVKVPGLFEDVDDIWNLPIKSNHNATVKLSDVAQIGRTFKDASTFVRVDGQRAVTLDVVNRRGTNVIQSVDAIKAVMERETKNWPNTIHVKVINDRSVNVRAQLGSIENGVILAIFLVMAACMGLLGVRNGLLVGLAIPGSFLAGILVMYALGMSINFVAVFGLILVTGMLVDDAIIVVENADRRIMAGQMPFYAFSDSAKRLAIPVITSTLTTVAAFVPLMFWPGFIGQFMGLLPFTVIAVLLASLVMGLVFVPAVGGLLPATSAVKATLTTVDDNLIVQPTSASGWTKVYVDLLEKCLKHPWRVLSIALILLFVVPASFFAFGKGMTLNPPEEPRSAALRIHALGNMSLEEQDRLVAEVERRIRGIPDFDHVYTRTGRPAGASSEDEDVIGEIRLLFKEWNERRPADVLLNDALSRIEGLPGIIVESKKTMHMSNDTNIEILIASKEPALLMDATHKIRQGMNRMEGLRNVDDTLPLPGIEWQLDVDRGEAAKYGADLTTVGESIRLITNGLRLGRYRPNDSVDEIDIVVRYPAEYRNLRQLDAIRIETRDGLVPISNFVERKPMQEVSEIQRVDGKRIMKITSGTQRGVFAGDKVKEIKQMIAGLNLDSRIEVHFKGEEELRQENSNFLLFAFGSAVFLIAMILLAEFNSFFAVMLILSAVVLSTIGVFAGLLIAQTPFIMTMTGVGVIACAGVIVKNNIVLLDTYNIFKHENHDPRDAILKTCMQRLRPIMLTNLTAILGLVPIALQLHVDFFHRVVEYGTPALQFWKHLAIALIYGLGFATALTLVVTPSVLMIQANLAAKAKLITARRKNLGERASHPAVQGAEVRTFHRPAAE
ncbi:MAG: efflux RND transporter permease subunit [Rhodospirillaceae bacterium]|nr:efflux RND transporter permease subunit [Rhodospirillaceae bacterium]